MRVTPSRKRLGRPVQRDAVALRRPVELGELLVQGVAVDAQTSGGLDLHVFAGRHHLGDQLAFDATWHSDETCSLTDSIGVVLEPRRDRLSTWDRLTIDLLLAYCRGEVAEAVDLLGARIEPYPRSGVAKAHYAMALEGVSRPRTAREVLLGMDPERDLGWRHSPEQVWPRYWSRLATTYHTTGEYQSELAITDRWQDSAAGEWREIRGRALAAMGREREVRELLATGDTALESFASEWLRIAAELGAHGHQRTATAMAESVLTRLEFEPDTGWVLGSLLGVDRLLGKPEHERSVLERIAGPGIDTLDGLDVWTRLAVLSGDTGMATGSPPLVRSPFFQRFAFFSAFLTPCCVLSGLSTVKLSGQSFPTGNGSLSWTSSAMTPFPPEAKMTEKLATGSFSSFHDFSMTGWAAPSRFFKLSRSLLSS